MGVANAPGTEIFPGELGKALQILKDGGQVNYQGATMLSSLMLVKLLVLIKSLK